MPTIVINKDSKKLPKSAYKSVDSLGNKLIIEKVIMPNIIEINIIVNGKSSK